MDRHNEDDFVTVVDDQTVDIQEDKTPEGAVAALRFRSGLIFTERHAAHISRVLRVLRDSKNPGIYRRDESEQNPPDASAP